MTKIEDVLALLSKGAKEWNDHLSILRDQEFGSDINDPEIRIENVTFEDLDIEEFEFSSIIFYRCMFKKCHFSSCRWAGAEFVECTMDVALFIDGDGEDLKITSSKLKDCKFGHIRMGEGAFSNSNFDEVDFKGCSWDGDEFSHCVFVRCIFVDCSLEECEFEACRFHFSNLSHSTFRHCEFNDISLSGSDFMNIMGNSSLRFPSWHDIKDITEEDERAPDGSKFLSCIFSGSELNGLDFGCSDLGNSSFHRTSLKGANLGECSGLSAGHFEFCDINAATLPPPINFDSSVGILRDLGGSLQRLSYFSVAFCVSAILASISDLGSNDKIRFPLTGWDLQPASFAVVIGTTILVLQIMVMVRSDNLACRASRLPAMLQNGAPLPTALQDTFIADLAWKFLHTPSMHPGFAPRSYAWLSIFIAFLVLYFQFPISTLWLCWSAFLYGKWITLKAVMVIISLVSLGLAALGAFRLRGSLRGLSVTGRRKDEFN
ncbi:MAG TPA: pentapeptide repeat-containing protein [Xanthobacteraceae bacterium]|nr:pentapeptide repeat-containing protein [Xanthobacteraceae bacterium]